MDDIIKKLLDGGVSNDIVEQLKAGLGNTFETELVTNGLKGAAEKIGIDTKDLPNIDFKTTLKATQDLIEKAATETKAAVSDVGEGIESAKDTAIEESRGLFAKIRGFFTKK